MTGQLIPKWQIGEDVAYEIHRQEYLEFVHNHGPQFERSYPVVLRLLEDNVIEAHYPTGLLPNLKFLSEFDLSNPLFSSPKSLYYAVNELFQIEELLNAENLQKDIEAVSAAATQVIIAPEEQDDLQWHLSHISENYEQLEKYFLLDAKAIHTFYGIIKREEIVEDLAKPSSLLEQWSNALLSKLGLGLGEMNVLHAWYTALQGYSIQTLSGIDTISTLTRQDFDQIGALFVNGEFDFEQYEDITLHHSCYQYCPSTDLLDSYLYQMKIDTPKMHKGKRISIRRADHMRKK
ncbi:MAG: hypothetical protein KTR30_09235 [Saprospiraceae bacterium]|nr:hypothetical protein [Saprospiraceae bacterium]